MNGVRNCVVVVSLILAVAFVIGACGGSVSKGDAPSWYLNPPKDKDKIYGTGASNKMSSIEFAKKVADDNARQDIASVIETSIQSMIKQYMQQSGTMDETRTLQFAETVSKNVVNVKLTGVIISLRDVREGRYFSLAEVSKDSINNALLSAARDAQAEYSELKANKAFEDLEKAIEKSE